MKTAKLKKIPPFKNDRDAEQFVDTADLSEYDLSGFRPMHFEIAKKSAALNIHIPQLLLDVVKQKAEHQGVPYTRYVRMLIEQDIAR